MAHKVKKFEKMIRVKTSVSEQESYNEETINEIRFSELECLKHGIFVNSLRHIENDVLRTKCLDIITHYGLFKNDETHYKINELCDEEKKQFKKCIAMCIRKECTQIINEKESIPTDLLKIINAKRDVTNNLNDKLNDMLSLLNKYISNKNEIDNAIFKLLNSSYVNISEAQKLAKQVDVIKNNSYKLQNDIINKFSRPEELLESFQKYYISKENKYAENLTKLKDLQSQQDKYNQVDGPQYRALVQRFIQAQEIIKIKTEMFNNC